jgi:hypothetical protein
VVQLVDSLDLSTNIKLACLCEQVVDGRMLLVAAEYFFGLLLPV